MFQCFHCRNSEPIPKSGEVPSKQTQPADYQILATLNPSHPTPLLSDHPVKFPDPNKGFGPQVLAPHLFSQAPCWVCPCVVCGDPLSGTHEHNKLLPCKPCSLLLWLHQLYHTLLNISLFRTENQRQNNLKCLSSHPSWAVMVLRDVPPITQSLLLERSQLKTHCFTWQSYQDLWGQTCLRNTGSYQHKVDINPETVAIGVDWGKLEKIELYLDKSSNCWWLRLDWEPKAKSSLSREPGF